MLKTESHIFHIYKKTFLVATVGNCSMTTVVVLRQPVTILVTQFTNPENLTNAHVTRLIILFSSLNPLIKNKSLVKHVE